MHLFCLTLYIPVSIYSDSNFKISIFYPVVYWYSCFILHFKLVNFSSFMVHKIVSTQFFNDKKKKSFKNECPWKKNPRRIRFSIIYYIACRLIDLVFWMSLRFSDNKKKILLDFFPVITESVKLPVPIDQCTRIHNIVVYKLVSELIRKPSFFRHIDVRGEGYTKLINET